MPLSIDANGMPVGMPTTDAEWRTYADVMAAETWKQSPGAGGAASAGALADIIYQQNSGAGMAAQRAQEAQYNAPTQAPMRVPAGSPRNQTQEQIMAANRWLLTTPGYGIGVQTSANRHGTIWPGTMSPGRSPTAIAQAQGRPVPTQQAARPPDNRGGPGMSVAARQGLYPMTGSSRPAQPRPVTYVPPGVRASTNAYTNTPTQNGWDVAPPGVDADPSQGQFDSWTNQPLTMDDMTQAIYDAGY